MYENITYEEILEQMLDRIPSNIDKREGSIIYDAIAPAAAELAQMYIELDNILNETFADTATGDFLDKRCAERGIVRTEATHAIVQAECTPININMIGERFSCGDHNYVAIYGENGVYQLQCETSGSEANNVSGDLIPINYIQGLENAKITQILIPGEDVEDDESLRQRYFDSLSSQAFGGNVADYKEKTKSIDGVGGVKVTPTPGGVGGTVLLTITASDYSAPSTTLIGKVQDEIDMIAPIGHVVTVDSVISKKIDIKTKITYQNGWNWAAAGKAIENAVDEYFKSLSKTWDENTNLIVRISGIEQKILNCPGVIDVENTSINNLTSNIQLGENEIPTRGDFNDGT